MLGSSWCSHAIHNFSSLFICNKVISRKFHVIFEFLSIKLHSMKSFGFSLDFIIFAFKNQTMKQCILLEATVSFCVLQNISKS